MMKLRRSYAALCSLALAAIFSLLANAASAATPGSAVQSEAANQPAAASEAKLIGNHWKLVDLPGRDLEPYRDKLPQITLVEDGARIAGFTGCNRFLGTYQLQQDRLSVNSDLTATRRACPKGMDLEADFLKALQSIDSWKIVDGTLELYRDKGLVARFKTN